MDTVATEKRFNSRWTRDPIIGDDDRPTVARITERDIGIFKVLTRYRYLPADYIQTLVGGELKPLVHRLNLLSRRPNLYIHRPEQQRHNANANYRRLIYELDERGAHFLEERGAAHRRPKYLGNFAHELMVCQIEASFELGTRSTPHVRLITWTDILASDSLPNVTRQSPKPHYIPVGFTANGERYHTEIAADGQPFGLERIVDGGKTYLFFPGIEADCGTEPVDTSDLRRSSIYKKFAAYRAIAEQGVYASHFGFPNFFVPFITSTTTRLDSMMNLLERLTDGRGSKMFLFKTFPAFTSYEKPPAPSGHMLTEPWQRAGYPPLNLVKS